MTRTRVAAIALALAACTPARPPARPPAPPPTDGWPIDVAWTRLPAVEPSPPPRIPEVVETELANGVRVVAVSTARVPLVAITTLHRAAGSREDGAQAGVAGFAAELLATPELARDLEALGARFDADIATDYASTHALALVDQLDATLAAVAAAIAAPRYPAAAVERLRAQRLAELDARAQRPRTLAALAFDRVVFGAHPYAHPPLGERATVAALTAADVRAFHERAYEPASTTVLVVGGAPSDALIAAVARAFGGWVGHGPAAAPPPPPPPAPPPAIVFLDRPGAAEAGIVIGRRIDDAAAGDRLAGDVATVILGGGPDARLDRRLHGELGLTSGVAASAWRGGLASSWSIVMSTRTPDAARAIREALALVDAARAIDPTPAELARARADLIRGALAAAESTAGLARALERLLAQDRSRSLAGYAERLGAVTATAARVAADRAWAHPTIVIVGDRAAIAPALAPLGLPIVAGSE